MALAPSPGVFSRLQPSLLGQLGRHGWQRAWQPTAAAGSTAAAVIAPTVAVTAGSQHIMAIASAPAMPAVSIPLVTVPAPTTTVFSARAKMTNRCLPWLKSSKLRSSFSKKFEVQEVYKSELSAIQVATCIDNSEQQVVIKTFFKEKLVPRPDLQQKVKLEWDIHATLDHPNIIQAYLASEDLASVGLYMEHAGDSDAYSYLTAKKRECMREEDAKALVADTLCALQYLHDLGIVHRDVKSENVFRTAEGTWKLGDFGSALRLGDARLMTKQPLKLEGTFSFAAPEYIAIWNSFTRQELLSATSFKLDSWSVGALAYDVLCGRAPFAEYDDIPREVEREAILAKDPEYPCGLSYDAVSFMKQALERDVQKRPSIKQLAAHSWFGA